ncbi:unnamed protein product [Rhizoctonia solani]|uniref:Uncharacterized protein n=1 Tax=Rhizoctonia solani TaxID=456999 RepID=A0A8H3DY40_9AGAM|nr:unnamed protein product [Rhizoctonia solani]
MAPTRLNRKFKQLRGSETVLGDESAKSGSEEPVDRGNNSGDTIGESDSDGTSDNESGSDDAPEAESLSGGRAAEDTRAGALKRHEEKLHELRKIKNKAREEFIRSTKASKLPAVDDSENHATPGGVDTENENDGEIANEVLQSDRLPDSIFAVAHESLQESTERKRMNKPSRDVPAKRRRLREVPVEKVVNGRALRVAVDINAPPAISFTSTRKVKNSAKGGSAFRRKWKKVDAMRAQVRSRTGPSRNFVTTVQ